MHTKEEILKLVEKLDYLCADELETEELEFKPWRGRARDNQAVAAEWAVCLANAKGGTIVFGVEDKVVGRSKAIHGCRDYQIDNFKNAIYQATTPSIRVRLEELKLSEGTLLLIHVPAADSDTTYGTVEGLYKIRVGTSCRGLPPSEHRRERMSIGAIDWSAEPVECVTLLDLDSLEIARYRNTLRNQAPESDLPKLSDEDLLKAVRALDNGRVCNAGILIFGRKDIIQRVLPQHELIFVAHKSPTDIYREPQRQAALAILDRMADLLLSPEFNPVRTLPIDLFMLEMPRYPTGVLREALLNAIVHRDYTEQGQVYVRLEKDELVISNPGGFIGGITPRNILTHEARQRNKRLTEIVEKSRLVERAGIGRRRIFIPMLSFGKPMPRYSADEHTVTLNLYGTTVNERVALFVVRKQKEGIEFGIDELILLNFLVAWRSIDVQEASRLCQRDIEDMKKRLDDLSQPGGNLLERRGQKRGVTYHLERSVAVELLGKVKYSQMKDIEAVRFPELIRQYVELHGSIGNQECRELLKLGDSASASVRVSQILTKLSGQDGFLMAVGQSRIKRRYLLRKLNQPRQS